MKFLFFYLEIIDRVISYVDRILSLYWFWRGTIQEKNSSAASNFPVISWPQHFGFVRMKMAVVIEIRQSSGLLSDANFASQSSRKGSGKICLKVEAAAANF